MQDKRNFKTPFRDRVNEDIEWYKKHNNIIELVRPEEMGMIAYAYNMAKQDYTSERVNLLCDLLDKIEECERNNNEYDDELYNLYQNLRRTFAFGLTGKSDQANRMDETLYLVKIGDIRLRLRSYERLVKYSQEITVFFEEFYSAILTEFRNASTSAYAAFRAEKLKSLANKALDNLKSAINSSGITGQSFLLGTTVSAVQEYWSLSGSSSSNIIKLSGLAENPEELKSIVYKTLDMYITTSRNKPFIEGMTSLDDIQKIAQQCASGVILRYCGNTETTQKFSDMNKHIFSEIFNEVFIKVRESNSSAQKKSTKRSEQEIDDEDNEADSRRKIVRTVSVDSSSSADDATLPLCQQAENSSLSSQFSNFSYRSTGIAAAAAASSQSSASLLMSSAVNSPITQPASSIKPATTNQVGSETVTATVPDGSSKNSNNSGIKQR